uniref:Uncharacterized protein n=1 Tax=Anopheles dirus TaxID=7168 RepID=A0A182NAZ9_9DIPT
MYGLFGSVEIRSCRFRAVDSVLASATTNLATAAYRDSPFDATKDLTAAGLPMPTPTSPSNDRVIDIKWRI